MPVPSGASTLAHHLAPMPMSYGQPSDTHEVVYLGALECTVALAHLDDDDGGWMVLKL